MDQHLSRISPVVDEERMRMSGWLSLVGISGQCLEVPAVLWHCWVTRRASGHHTPVPLILRRISPLSEQSVKKPKWNWPTQVTWKTVLKWWLHEDLHHRMWVSYFICHRHRHKTQKKTYFTLLQDFMVLNALSNTTVPLRVETLTIQCCWCVACSQVLCRHGSSNGAAQQAAVAYSPQNDHFSPHGADHHRHCAPHHWTRRTVQSVAYFFWHSRCAWHRSVLFICQVLKYWAELLTEMELRLVDVICCSGR